MTKFMRNIIRLALVALSISIITLIAAPAAAQMGEIFEPPDDDKPEVEKPEKPEKPGKGSGRSNTGNTGNTGAGNKGDCDEKDKVKDKDGKTRCPTDAEKFDKRFKTKKAEMEAALRPKIVQEVKKEASEDLKLNTGMIAVGAILALVGIGFVQRKYWKKDISEVKVLVKTVDGRVDGHQKDLDGMLKPKS